MTYLRRALDASGAAANSGDPVQIQVWFDGVVAEEWYHVQGIRCRDYPHGVCFK